MCQYLFKLYPKNVDKLKVKAEVNVIRSNT